MINNYVKVAASLDGVVHPADYDNVVRFELRGKFSKGTARPRINMEELD